jgi:uncharacterized membrane protein YphA (DoxX/SURF4 family)
MFEQASSAETRSPITDWCVRGGIALAFIVFGWEKFSTFSMWPKFFQQVGIGQWFRYFTGVVEILGGVLTFLPRTAQTGIAILALTMGSASLIWIFVVGPPGNAVITGIFFLGLSGLWWTRRSHE